MANDMKKENVRDRFKEFVKENLGREIGDVSDKQKSLALVQFYVTEIHNRTRPSISEDDFDDAYVDAANDLGVDFIYRDDHTVLILQAKYASQGKQTDIRDVLHFQSVLERLRSPEFRKNDKLNSAAADIDWENDNFVMRYLTLAKIEGQAKQQSVKQAQIPKGIIALSDRVDIEFMDESDLNQELRTALSQSSGIPSEQVLTAHGKTGRRSSIIEIDAGGYPSYVLVVSASQIVNLWRQCKDSLFTLNIRNYIGKTVTNKSIVDTANEHSEVFFHYNNGISCLATKVEIGPSGDRLITHGIQVINGAQTVKSLVKANQRSLFTSQEHEPLILVRVTQVPGYGEGGRFRSDVIRYNNTQNVIKASDFRSNDPIQQNLVTNFQKIKHFGKVVDYIPKRTDARKPNSVTVRLEEFSKIVYSFLGDPVSFLGHTSILFDDSEEGGYCLIFGDGKRAWDVMMPEEEFKLRSAIWWMGVAFGDKLSIERTTVLGNIENLALERKYILLFAARLLLERSFGKDGYQKYITKYYEGDWKIGEKVAGCWFESIYTIAKESIVYVYSQASKRPDFIHRNWVRTRAAMNDLSEYIAHAPIVRIAEPEIPF